MSDDSDLGGFGPNSPIVPSKVIATRAGRSKAATSHAGPSSKPASGTSRNKKVVDPPSDTSVQNEVIDVDDEEDGLMSAAEPPKRKTRRKKPTRETSVVNERQPTKGKGKEKASRPRSNNQDDMDARAQVEVIEESEGELVAIDAAKPNNVLKKGGANLREERWRRRYEELEQRYRDVSDQLERLHRVRETEAEQLLREKTEQYEAHIAALERINNELTSNLARVEPLSRSGKTSVLHLLTREAADAENRQIQQEALQWKSAAEGKDGIIEEKNRIIEEQVQREKELEFELDIERKRSATMKSERPPSVPRGRGGVLGADNPKHAELVSIYEDSTNLLITNLKSQPSSYLNYDDWNMTCIFTYVSPANEHKSVNFSLSTCWQPKDSEQAVPITSKQQLSRLMYYTPLELDKEPEDFVSSLGYLNAPFSFQRDQMPLFLRTLYSTINDAVTGGSGSEDASMTEDMEVVEN